MRRGTPTVRRAGKKRDPLTDRQLIQLRKASDAGMNMADTALLVGLSYHVVQIEAGNHGIAFQRRVRKVRALASIPRSAAEKHWGAMKAHLRW